MASTRKPVFAAFTLVFLLSFTLRLALTLINRQANDNHMEVVTRILGSGSLPTLDDCHECFQPKLFHTLVAQCLKAIGWVNVNVYRQTLIAQSISFLAGLVTVAIIGIFILGLGGFDDRLKLAAFALVAFNPPLIGLSSQATNDSLAILLSTLALFLVVRFFQRGGLAAYLLSLLAVQLGISTKTNTWVTAIAIALALLLYVLAGSGRQRRRLTLFLVFVAATALISAVNPLNQWRANLRSHGSPILVNLQRMPPVSLQGRGRGEFNGIVSITDGYLSFKYAELLHHPRNEYEDGLMRPFQTSLWSELYGRAHSTHFENWPPTWSTSRGQGFQLTRGILLLALLPTAILLAGAVLEGYRLLRDLAKRNLPSIREQCFGLFALTYFGYVLFAMLYAYLYQVNPVMKAIFVFPALLCMPLFFLAAGQPLYRRRSTAWQRLARFFEVWIASLCVLYVADVVSLILRLYSGKYGV